jgi:UDP-N-acetylglucosamine--N-acetylmuramyl-(pentapeptide) pyrophosphoryl-undecaprenol N-acetylglucosamine transferase
MNRNPSQLHVAIACGGTGGHLFPGLAVGRELVSQDCRVTLLISPKEVDQAAVAGLSGMEVATLPATGLQDGKVLAFVAGFWRAWWASHRRFASGNGRPHAILAMGGFTAAPPFLAARLRGAAGFLHESNTIPGRANRLLARFACQAFTGFPGAVRRLDCANSRCVGTPVRDAIARLREQRDPAAARRALGLDPNRPVLLVTGGSQGARGLNRLVLAALPELARTEADLQFLHLSGAPDLDEVRKAHAPLGSRSVVHAFLQDMHLALEAAEVVVSRAGASSMAELSALRLPAVLIPLPSAQDNHQFHNAEAFAQVGAALRLDQAGTSPGALIEALRSLRPGGSRRDSVQSALARMDQPTAASEIAAAILLHLREPFTQAARRSPSPPRRAATPDRPGPSPRLVPAKEVP